MIEPWAVHGEPVEPQHYRWSSRFGRCKTRSCLLRIRELPMPIYEYKCGSCSGVSSFFTKSIGVALEPVCQHCQSKDMQRRMSTFAMGKTVESMHRSQPSRQGTPGLDYYRDPRNIGRNTEESFSRHGVEMPDSLRETIDSARGGTLPKGLDV